MKMKMSCGGNTKDVLNKITFLNDLDSYTIIHFRLRRSRTMTVVVVGQYQNIQAEKNDFFSYF